MGQPNPPKYPFANKHLSTVQLDETDGIAEQILKTPLREESPIITAAPQRQWMLPMLCPHGHVWESELLTSKQTGRPVVNWKGAIFLDRFCPQCTRPGKRVPMTADDLGNVITQEEVVSIGEDAMPTMAVLLSMIFSGETGKYARVRANDLALLVIDLPDRVGGYLQRLEHMGYIKREVAPGEGEVWNVYLGDKVKLVQIVTES